MDGKSLLACILFGLAVPPVCAAQDVYRSADLSAGNSGRHAGADDVVNEMVLPWALKEQSESRRFNQQRIIELEQQLEASRQYLELQNQLLQERFEQMQLMQQQEQEMAIRQSMQPPMWQRIQSFQPSAASRRPTPRAPPPARINLVGGRGGMRGRL